MTPDFLHGMVTGVFIVCVAVTLVSAAYQAGKIDGR